MEKRLVHQHYKTKRLLVFVQVSVTTLTWTTLVRALWIIFTLLDGSGRNMLYFSAFFRRQCRKLKP